VLREGAICTFQEVIRIVDRPQEIENDAAMSFFGEKRAMPTKFRDKAPDRAQENSSFSARWGVGKSGGSGSKFLDCNFPFGAEPVFHLVTVFAAARLVKFVRT